MLVENIIILSMIKYETISRTLKLPLSVLSVVLCEQSWHPVVFELLKNRDHRDWSVLCPLYLPWWSEHEGVQ